MIKPVYVKRVTRDTYRTLDAGRCQVLGVAYRQELAAPVAVLISPSVSQRALSAAAGKYLNDEGHKDPSRPGRDWVKSATHSGLGRTAWNLRLTRSAGRAAAVSGIVVRHFLPPSTAAHSPCPAISRSTVQRAIFQLMYSTLHPLKKWSLPETRGGTTGRVKPWDYDDK